MHFQNTRLPFSRVEYHSRHYFSFQEKCKVLSQYLFLLRLFVSLSSAIGALVITVAATRADPPFARDRVARAARVEKGGLVEVAGGRADRGQV